MSSANRIISAIKMKSTAKLRGITGMYSNAKMRVAAETSRYWMGETAAAADDDVSVDDVSVDVDIYMLFIGQQVIATVHNTINHYTIKKSKSSEQY